jgi:hypothetical protein
MLGFKKKHHHRSHQYRHTEVKKADSLKPHSLNQLALFSTAVFVFSALFLQFLMTFQTAFLLKHYSISFIYRLFGIGFSSVSAVKWSEARIFLVFGMTVMVFFAAGLLLLFILKKQKQLNWKIKLVITWMAFLLIHSLPMGMLAGTFFFDGFGIAYTWLFDSAWVRGLVALLALLVVMYFRPFWMKTFLKSVYSTSFLSDNGGRKAFIKHAFILPWIFGIIILLPFALLHQAWFWLFSYVGLGIVVFPVFWNKIPTRKFLVVKSDKRIFHVKYPLVLILAIAVFLWFVDFISKTNF